MLTLSFLSLSPPPPSLSLSLSLSFFFPRPQTLETLNGASKDAAAEWLFDARMRLAVEQMFTMVQAHLETQLASVY